jgi:hypothetical protein
MTKAEAKVQIDRLKEELANHKETYKRINENFKRHIADLQKQASYQKDKESKARIKSQIASKKDSFVRNEKRNEKDGIERIKNRIEYIKSQIR